MSRLGARVAAPARNERGVALFAAIAGMLLLSTMIAALVVLARNENLIAQLNKDEAQAAYAAEAGANWGRRVMLRLLSTDLPARVFTTPRNTMKAYLQAMGANCYTCGAQFIIDNAIPASGPTFQACAGGCPEPDYSAVGNIPDAQQTVLTITCPGMAGCPANMAFTTRVIVSTHPTIPPNITNFGNGALFTYVWRIESSGTAGRARQRWVIHDSSVPDDVVGSFTIALNAEFVKYAHFIDQFQDAGSGEPWVSFRHVYTGPVHTNTRFSILGDTSTPGEEGPTFRSEATQTMSTTRFNNNGSATNLSRDSSSRDWPLLGPTPGLLCKTIDCSGFTRTYDFNPTTTGACPGAGCDPIPFPGGLNPQDRTTQICVALGISPCVANPVPACGGACPLVLVSNDTTATALAPGNLLGGIYVTGNVLDLRLAHNTTGPNIGQVIVVQTAADRRTVISEDRPNNRTTVRRECLKNGAQASDAGDCNGGATWFLHDPTPPPLPAPQLNAPREQTFNGTFTETATPPPTFDRGVLFVTGNIGLVNTLNGLRRGDQTGPLGAGTFAIYQNPALTADGRADGMRLTVVADGNIWITGPLNYRVDPRGADGIFSDPIPGNPGGTSADDEMDVQNVLGVVAWGNGVGVASGIRLSSALNGNLDTHGMVFAANLSNQPEPSGQFSFDDPNGPFRGESRVLGGVVQKTMGTFGQPSSNLGYSRDWVYDERFRYRALSPPAFPGFPNFTGSTSLGIDSYTWRLGLFR